MRLTITLLYYERSTLLRQAVNALSRCHGLERWKVLAGTQRPNRVLEDIVRRAVPGVSGFGVLSPEGEPTAYERISYAMHDMLHVAFDYMSSGFNLHLDEDIALSPDALLYAEEMAHEYRDDPGVFTVTAFRNANPEAYHVMGETYYHAPDDVNTHPADAHARHMGFVPWAWGTWPDRWREMRRAWNFQAWDYGCDETRGKRGAIYPLLSRAQNHGNVNGTTPGGMAARADRVATGLEWEVAHAR